MAGRIVLAQLTGRLKTVESRHHDVHQHHIGQRLLGLGNTLLAAFRGNHLVTVLAQDITHLASFRRRIVDYQYSGHISSSV